MHTGQCTSTDAHCLMPGVAGRQRTVPAIHVQPVGIRPYLRVAVVRISMLQAGRWTVKAHWECVPSSMRVITHAWNLILAEIQGKQGLPSRTTARNCE